jgi:glyoxylate reductase
MTHMSKRILITREILPRGWDILREAGYEVVQPPSIWDRDTLAAHAPQFDAILCQLRDTIDERVLQASQPRCRIFSTCAVGYDNIDISAARSLGIILTHTPGVLTEATADLAFALMLAAARRICEADRFVRDGRWTGWSMSQLLGADLFGRTLGIVGAGRIGTAVARRATGFSMKLLYTAREDKPQMHAMGARRVPLDELLSGSDFVSLHVPETPQTKHMIDRAAFQRMRPHAILINTARGPIVEESALIEALRDRKIAAAGLDVFDNEPHVCDALLHMENVVLLPHIGSATQQTRSDMAALAANNIVAVLSGQPPLNPIP